MNALRLDELLRSTQYDPEETHTQFLVDGFTNGFDLHYEGPENRTDTSTNIPFTVGNRIEMWNKVMKEVMEYRLAGPYETIPFEHYVQSPIGLIPKAGNKTRLIFHLSIFQKKMITGNQSTITFQGSYVQSSTMIWM